MSWHQCSRCNAKVGPSEGRYHECYASHQEYQVDVSRSQDHLLERNESGGKRVQR